jgi:hypothetical protein
MRNFASRKLARDARRVAQYPRFLTSLAASNPKPVRRLRNVSSRLAYDAEGGLDPNDLPEWPAEPEPIDQLRAELAEHLSPGDVERALRIISGEENDDPEVRQELSPIDRLLAWLREVKGIGDEAVAKITGMLVDPDEGLSEVGETLLAADRASMRRGKARALSGGGGNMDYLAIRRAEAETGVNILALDSVNGPADLYRAALHAAGVNTRGVYELSALRAMHGILLRRQAGGGQFAADVSLAGGTSDWLKKYGVG